MPMYNLIEYRNNYSKTSGSLWQFYRDEPFITDNGAIADFPADKNNSASFKYKTKITGRIENDGTKNVETRVPLKYLSNFRRTLERPLINCEINFILTWSGSWFIINALIDGQEPTFTIDDTNLYVPVLILLIQNNEKLLEQVKSGIKRTINWNKHEVKITVEQQNRYLDFFFNPSFQGVDILFVLSFQNTGGRASSTRRYLLIVEIKDYKDVIDGRNFFDQPVKNNFIAYDNIRKIATGQGDDYKTGGPLAYDYFNSYYEMIAIDLSKQQEHDTDPKSIQQINFTANLDGDINKTLFFIIDEVKETVFDFSQGIVKVL